MVGTYGVSHPVTAHKPALDNAVWSSCVYWAGCLRNGPGPRSVTLDEQLPLAVPAF